MVDFERNDLLFANCEVWYCNCQILQFCKFLLRLVAFVVLVVLLYLFGVYFLDIITAISSATLSLVCGMLASAMKIMMLPTFIGTAVSKPPSPISHHPVMAFQQPSCSKTAEPHNYNQLATESEMNPEAVSSKLAKSVDILAVDIKMIKTEILSLQMDNYGIMNRLEKLETETRSKLKVLHQRITEIDKKIDALSYVCGIVNDKLEGLEAELFNMKEEIFILKASLKDLAANVRNKDTGVCKKFKNTEFETESVIPCKSGNCPPNTPRYIEKVLVRHKIVVAECVDNKDDMYGGNW